METKKALIMCRTGMGSSLMLKIKVEKLINEKQYPLTVEHDVFSGFAGRDCDIIITMDDLADEFKDSGKYVIGVHDIMDVKAIEAQLDQYFDSLLKK